MNKSTYLSYEYIQDKFGLETVANSLTCRSDRVGAQSDCQQASRVRGICHLQHRQLYVTANGVGRILEPCAKDLHAHTRRLSSSGSHVSHVEAAHLDFLLEGSLQIFVRAPRSVHVFARTESGRAGKSLGIPNQSRGGELAVPHLRI